jgi:membrane fusion protein (multidrug efflux system)
MCPKINFLNIHNCVISVTLRILIFRSWPMPVLKPKASHPIGFALKGTILCTALAVLCLGFFPGCGGDKKGDSEGEGAASVTVTPVIQKTIPQYVEYVGQTEAPVSVEIRARVEGFIQEVAFVEGSEVKEGDLLFVIDPKPYEEKLARAKGKLAEAQASFLKAHQDGALPPPR